MTQCRSWTHFGPNPTGSYNSESEGTLELTKDSEGNRLSECAVDGVITSGGCNATFGDWGLLDLAGSSSSSSSNRRRRQRRLMDGVIDEANARCVLIAICPSTNCHSHSTTNCHTQVRADQRPQLARVRCGRGERDDDGVKQGASLELQGEYCMHHPSLVHSLTKLPPPSPASRAKR